MKNKNIKFRNCLIKTDEDFKCEKKNNQRGKQIASEYCPLFSRNALTRLCIETIRALMVFIGMLFHLQQVLVSGDYFCSELLVQYNPKYAQLCSCLVSLLISSDIQFNL